MSDKANIGVVGLAVMGSNLARNLASREGNRVAIYNRSVERTTLLVQEHPEANFIPSETIDAFVASLATPRTAIIMVQAGAGTDAVINQLAERFEPGDIIVDGGNALFSDTLRREKDVSAKGIHFVGAGISGGEEGALKGPSIMPGGSAEAYKTLGPILSSIAAVAEGEPCVTHVGTDGAGHFVKMIHNGIEYGMMQAFAEGFDILKGAGQSFIPAERRYNLDLADITELWRRGSVVSSWLLDLSAIALAQDPELSSYSGHVEDSGEGRWTLLAAIEEAVPAEVLSAALYARFRSRQDHTFAEKTLSAMRKQFGGHQEPQKPKT
jgi:6-phosphogluconate dehydrogenase